MEKRLSAVEACELVGEELGVERSCIRPCLDESDSRVCCLVSFRVFVWHDLSWNVKIDSILYDFSSVKTHFGFCACSFENYFVWFKLKPATIMLYEPAIIYSDRETLSVVVGVKGKLISLIKISVWLGFVDVTRTRYDRPKIYIRLTIFQRHVYFL